MNFSFKKTKPKSEAKEISYKKERSNPHKIWMAFIVFSILVVVGELGFFSWYFLRTTQNLDDITNPELKTNASKIKAITKIMDNIETAVNGRLGVENTSQKAE
jgi:cytoskeletal protein RodZ